MVRAILSRAAGVALALALLAGCGRQSDLAEEPVALGDFRLGLNIVFADNMQKVPISRDATVEEWEEAVKTAIDDRFGRYDGNRFYNIGIAVDGYALAPPGIPVVAAPKSVVVVTVNVWDDATQTRLNGEPKQFTVFESLSGETVIGSGLTGGKDKQMRALSYNVAKEIEGWFLENPQWFAPDGPVPDPRPDGSPAQPTPRSTAAPAAPAATPVATPVEAATPPRPQARPEAVSEAPAAAPAPSN